MKRRILQIVWIGFLSSGILGWQGLSVPLSGADIFIVPKKSSRNVLGRASWYSEESPGVNPRTANNEIFDDGDLTCAMWGVPFNQRIKVTNRSNGKSVVVRVNDRGPHLRFTRGGRVIDLTKEAFSKLSDLKRGLIEVELELL